MMINSPVLGEDTERQVNTVLLRLEVGQSCLPVHISHFASAWDELLQIFRRLSVQICYHKQLVWRAPAWDGCWSAWTTLATGPFRASPATHSLLATAGRFG